MSSLYSLVKHRETNLSEQEWEIALALRHRCLAQSVSSPVLSAAVAWFIPAPPVLGKLLPVLPAPDPTAELQLWRVHGLQLCSCCLPAALHCKHLPLHEPTSGESPESADQVPHGPGALQSRAVAGPPRGWDTKARLVLCSARQSPRGTRSCSNTIDSGSCWACAPGLTVLLSYWNKRLLDIF